MKKLKFLSLAAAIGELPNKKHSVLEKASLTEEILDCLRDLCKIIDVVEEKHAFKLCKRGMSV